MWNWSWIWFPNFLLQIAHTDRFVVRLGRFKGVMTVHWSLFWSKDWPCVDLFRTWLWTIELVLWMGLVRPGPNLTGLSLSKSVGCPTLSRDGIIIWFWIWARFIWNDWSTDEKTDCDCCCLAKNSLLNSSADCSDCLSAKTSSERRNSFVIIVN